MWSICLGVDRNKCGQTSRAAVRTEIQTCRHIKVSLHSNNFLLPAHCFRYIDPIAERCQFKLASVCVILSLGTSMFCYTRIHLKLRHHQVQVQNHIPQVQQNRGVIPALNIAKYKKSVSSIMWVQLALAACYIPWVIVVVQHILYL